MTSHDAIVRLCSKDPSPRIALDIPGIYGVIYSVFYVRNDRGIEESRLLTS